MMRRWEISRTVLALATIIWLLGGQAAALAAEAPQATVDGPRFAFDHRAHHFGKVTQGKIVTHQFPFSNVGNAPLVIDDVSTPCGCTAVLPDKSTLAPGESSYIEVNYDSSARSGEVTRIITVLSNDALEPELTLDVTATVDASMHAGFEAGIDLFGPKCGKCHAVPNMGKMGQELYETACWFCHGTFREGNTATALTAYPKQAETYLRHIITDGRPGTEMPGFGHAKGGPLDDAQIESLIEVLHQEPAPAPKTAPEPEPAK